MKQIYDLQTKMMLEAARLRSESVYRRWISRYLWTDCRRRFCDQIQCSSFLV